MQVGYSNKFKVALVALLAGVFALSFGAIFVKFSSGELSAYAIATDRLLVSIAIFGLWNGGATALQRLHTNPVEPDLNTTQTSPKTKWLLLAAGILWFAALSSLFWAQTQTNIAIASLLHNLAPIFTSLGAWWFFGQTFNGKFAIGMIITLIGVGAIGWEEMQIAEIRLSGDIAAILSALFLSAYLLIIEHLRTQLSPITIQIWICGVGALVSFPLLLFTQEQIFPSSLNTWLAILALACICQVLGHGLLTFSLDSLSSVLVSLIHLLEPVFAGLLAWLIFSEQLGLWSWLGFSIVLLGLCLAISSQTADGLHDQLEPGVE